MIRSFIEIELRISGHTICGRYLDMDERMRCDRWPTKFFSSHGFRVISHWSPELSPKTIYLRGITRERDMDFFVGYAEDPEKERKIILESLAEFVNFTYGCKAIIILKTFDLYSIGVFENV